MILFADLYVGTNLVVHKHSKHISFDVCVINDRNGASCVDGGRYDGVIIVLSTADLKMA